LGSVMVTGALSAAPDVALVGARLLGNHPNPFNPSTTIRFALPAAGTVRLTVHDVAGRLVRTLLDGGCETGEQGVVWDGRDDAGRSLGSGVYLYRLTTAAGASAGRMTLVK
ncbi:MAG TPA: FlgD immunoglobulin-like domain containing protein, partial [Candidatus Krumholzibacteria bacterium]|nr:FlgD immunoglobulin-like domain containing protein [Candidatus Krumholzibacteria bacterium]